MNREIFKTLFQNCVTEWIMVRYSSTWRERNEKECKDDVEHDKKRMNQTQFYTLMKKKTRLVMPKKELKSAVILSLKERATWGLS